MNKKIVTSLCVGACGTGLVCTSLVGLSLSVGEKIDYYDTGKPFNRGSDYEKFGISKWFKDDLKFDNILKTRIVNDKYEHYIHEDEFKQTIKENVVNALGKIERFKNDVNAFKYVVLYKITDSFVDVDLVWYASQMHYYDQFRITIF